jgi:hypothetical protein
MTKKNNNKQSKQNIDSSPKVTRIMSVLGLNIRLKIPCTGDRGSKFRVWSLLFLKRHFNTWIWTFYGSARDEPITTRTIFCMCCHLDGFCLWFIGLRHWWSSQTRKDLTQETSVPSAGSAERCAAGYQIISLFNVSFLLNVKHTSRIM